MLQLKMKAEVNADRTMFLIKDLTGTYNVSSNPGGWGLPNYPLATTNRLFLRYRKVGDPTYKTLDLTGTAFGTAFFSGSELGLFPADFGLEGEFWGNGDHELEWLTIFDYIQPGNTGSFAMVTTTAGSKNLTRNVSAPVTDLRLVFQPRAGIYRSVDDKLFLVDMAQPRTANTAVLEEEYDQTSNMVLSSVMSTSNLVLIADDIDKCIMTVIAGLAITDCGCEGEKEIDNAVFMSILKFGMDVNQECGNYQGAADIRKTLLTMCNCKC